MESSLTLLLLLLCLVTSPSRVWSASDTAATATTSGDEAKIKVSTKIELRLKNTYSKIEDPHDAAFKDLIESAFNNELPRIQSLHSSSPWDTSYKLSHVRTRILEQWWGDEYQVQSSSSSTRNLSSTAGKRLQPLIVRLLVTGRYSEHSKTHSKLPTSADFYSEVRQYFDNGGGDILVDEYITKIQSIHPGEAAHFFTEVEEIELIERNGAIIKEQSDASNQVNLPGLVAGCVLAAVAVICLAAFIYIRQRKRHRPIIITRKPGSATFLPSEIDLESMGGSIISNLYASSFKPDKNLLPPRSSEDADVDRTFTIDDHSTQSGGSKDLTDSFLQVTADGAVAVEGSSQSTPAVDYCNTDVEKQAQARLLQYLSKHSPVQGLSEVNKDASSLGSRKSPSTASVGANSPADSSTLASQEAILLKNLGVTGAFSDDDEEDEARDEEAMSLAKSEGESMASTSEQKAGNSVSSSSKVSANESIDLESSEVSLLKNLGILASAEDDKTDEEGASSASSSSSRSSKVTTDSEPTSESVTSPPKADEESMLLVNKEETSSSVSSKLSTVSKSRDEESISSALDTSNDEVSSKAPIESKSKDKERIPSPFDTSTDESLPLDGTCTEVVEPNDDNNSASHHANLSEM